MSLPKHQGWLDLQKAAKYLSLSVRTLRTYIGHREHPLPVRRVGGKWIGKFDSLDRWAESFPLAGEDIDQVVDDILKEVRNVQK